MTIEKGKITLKVLLVEDNPISNLMTQVRLKQLGINTVISVENGLEALNYLEGNTPDVIFLDIDMPSMDGFEFLNAVEKYDLCTTIPIIMLTSSARTCDEEKAMQYESVIDYIYKPLTLSKIERVLSKVGIEL